jgi:hypothetical protein
VDGRRVHEAFGPVRLNQTRLAQERDATIPLRPIRRQQHVIADKARVLVGPLRRAGSISGRLETQEHTGTQARAGFGADLHLAGRRPRPACDAHVDLIRRRKVHMATIHRRVRIVLIALALGLAVAGTAAAQTADQNKQKLMKYEEAERLVKANLDNFDDLDYNVFTNQKWTELHRSHSQDILVHWPDGHTTKGLETHIQGLKAMFAYAPDTRI